MFGIAWAAPSSQSRQPRPARFWVQRPALYQKPSLPPRPPRPYPPNPAPPPPPRSQASKSFFSEIISSINDIKFSRDGRYLLSRDYMSLKLWDLAMDNAPVSTYGVHEGLRGRLCELYESDAIFDKFDCEVSGDGRHLSTGTYSNFFRCGRLGGRGCEGWWMWLWVGGCGCWCVGAAGWLWVDLSVGWCVCRVWVGVGVRGSTGARERGAGWAAALGPGRAQHWSRACQPNYWAADALMPC